MMNAGRNASSDAHSDLRYLLLIRFAPDGTTLPSAKIFSTSDIYNESRNRLRSSFMAASDEVVIISGCRTPVGKFQGSLSDLRAPQLGALVVREAVRRANLDPKV